MEDCKRRHGNCFFDFSAVLSRSARIGGIESSTFLGIVLVFDTTVQSFRTIQYFPTHLLLLPPVAHASSYPRPRKLNGHRMKYTILRPF